MGIVDTSRLIRHFWCENKGQLINPLSVSVSIIDTSAAQPTYIRAALGYAAMRLHVICQVCSGIAAMSLPAATHLRLEDVRSL